MTNRKMVRPVFLLLVAALFASVADAQQRKEITIEQIAEGVLALNRDLRENNARLERHELRERQLGEHLKKTIAGLEKHLKKQQADVDALRSDVGRVVHGLNQHTESERQWMQRLQSSVEEIRSQLQNSGGNSGAISEELRQIRERLEALALSDGGGNANDLIVASRMLQEAADKLVSGESKLEDHATASRSLLEHFRSEVDRLKDVKKSEYDADDETSLSSVLEAVENTQKLVSELKVGSDRGSDGNETARAIAVLREDLLTSSAESTERIVSTVAVARLEATTGLSGLNVVLSEVKLDTTKSVEALRNLERVAVQTAEGVEEGKRRIELSGQQTLYELRKSGKANADLLNETIGERFEQLSGDILRNQTKTLRNMSAALESEISQVWRQIGIMYSQLTQSVSTLDRLQNQTESYVNGSLTTMGNMSGKVGQLSGTMAEVDGNLNYLLGRISLVTREFNMIKNELGPALDQARTDFAKLHNAVIADLPSKQPISEPIDDNLVGTE
ncbi:ERC protein 2 [Neocloeon triangulifer]|uniref:ERC protein 2 n=1 Tax=Neocloeon triangulifer TaxID=2078957 RepID=UPI00286F500F|nr:ERC protein 2 [Neocloeon triangulifer]